MAETHALSALKEKRTRLVGDLITANTRVIALKADLAAVDKCLKIFLSDVDPKATNGKSGLPKGSGSRMALEILREVGRSAQHSGIGCLYLAAVRPSA